MKQIEIHPLGETTLITTNMVVVVPVMSDKIRNRIVNLVRSYYPQYEVYSGAVGRRIEFFLPALPSSGDMFGTLFRILPNGSCIEVHQDLRTQATVAMERYIQDQKKMGKMWKWVIAAGIAGILLKGKGK